MSIVLLSRIHHNEMKSSIMSTLGHVIIWVSLPHRCHPPSINLLFNVYWVTRVDSCHKELHLMIYPPIMFIYSVIIITTILPSARIVSILYIPAPSHMTWQACREIPWKLIEQTSSSLGLKSVYVPYLTLYLFVVKLINTDVFALYVYLLYNIG